MIPLTCIRPVTGEELTLTATEYILRDIMPLSSDNDIIDKLLELENMEIKYNTTTSIIIEIYFDL